MYAKIKDIPQFPFAPYRGDTYWNHLQSQLNEHANSKCYDLNLDPDYQRGYVWTMEQKIKYIEYQLQGGTSGKEIYFNCPNWMRWDRYNKKYGKNPTLELVDGKQRITAILEFLNNKVKAFGKFFNEFEDWNTNMTGMGLPRLSIHINNLETEEEIVRWYLGMNTGGSIHTEADLKPALEKLQLLTNK
jgi:uncharacterized protein with ParB-like and HNH nuclease domain